MDTGQMGLDKAVRRVVYERMMENGSAPSMAEIAGELAVPVGDVRTALGRLGSGHVFVLQKDTGEVLMANPFSAVPTPFMAEVDGNTYFGNCIWDVLGIPALLKRDTTIRASCGDCGTAMTLRIRGGVLERGEGVPAEGGIAHFALPAARWWDNIVFT